MSDSDTAQIEDRAAVEERLLKTFDPHLSLVRHECEDGTTLWRVVASFDGDRPDEIARSQETLKGIAAAYKEQVRRRNLHERRERTTSHVVMHHGKDQAIVRRDMVSFMGRYGFRLTPASSVARVPSGDTARPKAKKRPRAAGRRSRSVDRLEDPDLPGPAAVCNGCGATFTPTSRQLSRIARGEAVYHLGPEPCRNKEKQRRHRGLDPVAPDPGPAGACFKCAVPDAPARLVHGASPGQYKVPLDQAGHTIHLCDDCWQPAAPVSKLAEATNKRAPTFGSRPPAGVNFLAVDRAWRLRDLRRLEHRRLEVIVALPNANGSTPQLRAELQQREAEIVNVRKTLRAREVVA